MGCSQEVVLAKVLANVATQVEMFTPDAPVSPTLYLSPSMRNAKLGDSTVVQLEVNVDEHTVKEATFLRGREMNERIRGRFGSVCLVVRRPGCSFCCEQAFSLVVLAAQRSQDFDGFGMFGIVKEADADGLVDFHDKYFPNPIFCDKSYSFYQALGDRKLSVKSIMSPASIVSYLFCEAYSHMTSKGSGSTSVKGEGLVLGGIIIFGRDGKPRYAYEEQAGQDVPLKEILVALHAVRREQEGI